MAACSLTGYLPVSHPTSPFLSFHLLLCVHKRGVYTCHNLHLLCLIAFLQSNFHYLCVRMEERQRISECVCKAVGAKRERARRGIVTFVHLSFRLSGAVITATGGSLLCLGLGRRAKSAVNGKTQRESLGKCEVPGGAALLCPLIDNSPVVQTASVIAKFPVIF